MSKSRAPFTHAVWWRYQNQGRIVSAWHDQPRLYRSEKAARMAARDLNKFYTNTDMGCFMYHVALPVGPHPNIALLGRSRINPTFY